MEWKKLVLILSISKNNIRQSANNLIGDLCFKVLWSYFVQYIVHQFMCYTPIFEERVIDSFGLILKIF